MNALQAPPSVDRNFVSGSDVHPIQRRTLPALRPVPPSPRWRNHWSGIALLVFLLIGGIFLASSLQPRSPAMPQPPPISRSGGTVLGVLPTGGGTLRVRTPTHLVVYLGLAGKQLVTQDNQVLSVSSVRSGDLVAIQSDRVLVDTSQTWTSAQGVVASPPDVDGDVMTVQLTPSRTILVNIGPQTRIDGQKPNLESRMSIRIGQQLRVEGVLDKTFDEMTQTRTIRIPADGARDRSPD